MMGLASCVYMGTVEEERGKGRLGFTSGCGGQERGDGSSGVLVADMLEGTKFALGRNDGGTSAEEFSG